MGRIDFFFYIFRNISILQDYKWFLIYQKQINNFGKKIRRYIITIEHGTTEMKLCLSGG